VFGTVATLLAISTLLMMKVRIGARNTTAQPGVTLRSLLSGLTFVRSKPVVLGAISLDLFASAVRRSDGAAADLRTRHSAHDVGWTRRPPHGPRFRCAVCALMLSVYPLDRRVGPWLFAGVAVFGAATIVFGLSTNIVVSVIALTLLGAGDMVSVYLRPSAGAARNSRQHPWPRQCRERGIHRRIERAR
jgi:hypothetical protein